MAIKLTDNFALNSQQPLDARNKYQDKAALKAVTDAVMDDGHLAYCMEDKKYYVYDSGNKVDANVGKWRELQTTVPGKGEAGGVASLGSDGKVPASQLPSYVDDVIDFGGLAGVGGLGPAQKPTIEQTQLANPTDAELKFFTWSENGKTVGGFFYVRDGKKYMPPLDKTSPEGGKIYVDVNTNTSYRWSGTGLVAIGGGSLVIGTDTGTAFDGAKGKALEDTVGKTVKDGYVVADKGFKVGDGSSTNVLLANGTTTPLPSTGGWTSVAVNDKNTTVQIKITVSKRGFGYNRTLIPFYLIENAPKMAFGYICMNGAQNVFLYISNLRNRVACYFDSTSSETEDYMYYFFQREAWTTSLFDFSFIKKLFPAIEINAIPQFPEPGSMKNLNLEIRTLDGVSSTNDVYTNILPKGYEVIDYTAGERKRWDGTKWVSVTGGGGGTADGKLSDLDVNNAIRVAFGEKPLEPSA